QRLPGQRAVSHLAIVTRQPGFANPLLKLPVRIDRGKVMRAPGSRIEHRKHQQRIEIAHKQKIHIKKAVRERTATSELSTAHQQSPLPGAHAYSAAKNLRMRSSPRSNSPFDV